METEVSNTFFEHFCASHNLKNLIKKPTRFKSVDNPYSIDLISKNHPTCFHISGIYETGTSDFPKLTFAVLKTFSEGHTENCQNAEIIKPLKTMGLGMN